jgi:hypothetical protein
MLEPMLRATGFPDGDVAGPDGLSPFPGNMNQLVFDLEAYTAALSVGTPSFMPAAHLRVGQRQRRDIILFPVWFVKLRFV